MKARSEADAAKLVAEVMDYKGKLVFDASRPDGTPRKLLDSSRLIEMGYGALARRCARDLS